ncbi:MAG: DUF5063 domain-containing protein [Alloprevotella sp.]|nr:DUF5063 domain-containing protein [Alloprevotella sp.]
MEQYVYSQPVLEWMTVCTEFCKQLEQCEGTERADFVEVMRVCLPMLYLKTSLLKKADDLPGFTEDHVTEDDYEYIRRCVATVMAEGDDYLDAFVEDFKYSEEPVLHTVSEDLADVYQAVRNAVETFREGHEEAMQVAVGEAIDSFETYWGGRLLSALRAIHDVRFTI